MALGEYLKGSSFRKLMLFVFVKVPAKLNSTPDPETLLESKALYFGGVIQSFFFRLFGAFDRKLGASSMLEVFKANLLGSFIMFALAAIAFNTLFTYFLRAPIPATELGFRIILFALLLLFSRKT